MKSGEQVPNYGLCPRHWRIMTVSLYNSNARLGSDILKAKESMAMGKENKQTEAILGKCSMLGFEKNVGYRFLCIEMYWRGVALEVKAWTQ